MKRDVDQEQWQIADIQAGLQEAVRQLIETSQAELAVTVNNTLTLLYWNIGQRIST